MIESTLAWFLAIFTPAEWAALFWLIGITLAATHTIKIAWRLSKFKSGSHNHMYLVSASIAMLAAFVIWPDQSVPWYVAGIVAGPLANLVFKLAFALMHKFAPDVAITLNQSMRK